jgi:adenine deaminase
MIKAGEIVFQRGHLRIPAVTPVQAIPASMRVGTYDTGSFAITAAGQHIRVSGVIDGELLTSHCSLQAPVRDGYLVSDPVRDLIKVAVIERHHGTGNIGLGMVRGFGLRKGALASSVSHDSHNIICVGCSDSDMFAAVRSIEKMGGGLVAVVDGRVLEKLPLPVAGLMSERPLNEVASQWERVRLAAEELGCTLNEPFMSLSFLALPVIPELKITDRGLFDVLLFEHVPLFY